MSDEPRPVVELRSSAVAEVRFPERIISVLAVPYETPTSNHPVIPVVAYRGRQYVESFARGAFTGVEARNGKVMANREHRKGATVGKVERFDPNAHEGLIADIKIAKTPAGDETLALADEGMIFPSVGFAVVKGSDQELDHRSQPNRRYIRRAFVDHMAFTEDPAYIGADVVSVRTAAELAADAAALEHVSTPRLDEWVQYVQSRRVGLTA